MLMVRAATADDRASQLNAQYKEARAKKDVEHAANYICEAATLNPNKYAKKCESARADVAARLKAFEGDLWNGQFKLKAKDYPGAIRDLSKIEFGPLRDQAQQLIAQARAQQSGAPAPDDQSRQALRAAQLSYERGDFARAVAQLSSIATANLQPEAVQILTNIRIYNATLAQAEALEQSGDYAGAQQKYSFAAAINPNGPGSIPQKQHHLEMLLDAQRTKAGQPALPAPPTDTKKGKAVTTPIDNIAKEKKALAAARAAEASGDDQAALAGFTRVLAIDGRQSEALAGKERILNKLRGDPKALEDTLASGIESFYSSHFIEANDAISLYLRAGGTQSTGAAHFYLGATFLSQAILAGPDKGKQDSLRQNARQEFVLAQQKSYRPIENEISPKILAEWKKSSSQQ